ncbi:cathepsin O-like isoform X2 [Ostrea edulis]|uniref:cathepsin O-like isoform X2 n=1 Tax=Ostrea edulis TaxID=37623 RepID=UPI0020946630|nr:cathepsin O-like isoform X2 [Ostrea edulis]
MINFRLVSVCVFSAVLQCIYSKSPFVFEFQQSQNSRETTLNREKNSRIQQFLNKPNGAKYGPTKFSHLSQVEFEKEYLSDLKGKQNVFEGKKQSPSFSISSPKLPQKVDWRNYNGVNYVSPIKNQNKCGGCWAFSTTETIESMYAIAHNVTPPRLSVQEVIDCSAGNYGCSGGDTCTALAWLHNTQSLLVYEEEYPLTDTSDFCKLLTNSSRGVTVKSFTCDRYVGKEQSMLQLLAHGPLVVAVDASTWNHYLGGIIQYHCGTKLNHAVQIVGYDLTGDIPFYIVRNSWGTDFGNDGYLYIKIGDNLCGIASEVATVNVN